MATKASEAHSQTNAQLNEAGAAADRRARRHVRERQHVAEDRRYDAPRTLRRPPAHLSSALPSSEAPRKPNSRFIPAADSSAKNPAPWPAC